MWGASPYFSCLLSTASSAFNVLHLRCVEGLQHSFDSSQNTMPQKVALRSLKVMNMGTNATAQTFGRLPCDKHSFFKRTGALRPPAFTYWWTTDLPMHCPSGRDRGPLHYCTILCRSIGRAPTAQGNLTSPIAVCRLRWRCASSTHPCVGELQAAIKRDLGARATICSYSTLTCVCAAAAPQSGCI